MRCKRPQTDAAPKRAPKGANHTNPPPHKGKWPATKQNSLRCISRTRVINLPHPRLHLHQPRLNLINVRNKSDLPTIPRSQLMRRPSRQQFNSRAVTAGPSTMIPGPPVPTPPHATARNSRPALQHERTDRSTYRDSPGLRARKSPGPDLININLTEGGKRLQVSTMRIMPFGQRMLAQAPSTPTRTSRMLKQANILSRIM